MGSALPKFVVSIVTVETEAAGKFGKGPTNGTLATEKMFKEDNALMSDIPPVMAGSPTMTNSKRFVR